jgi:hypothetical protein
VTVFTYSQLEGLWINAGGPKAVAYIAAAIALAESSGNSAALNKTDNGGTQTSVGLWQVSNGTHSYPSAWTTPAGNAAEAVAKYQGAGNSFSPWGTYTSGAYKADLNSSTSPDLSVAGGVGATSSSTGAATAEADCLFGLPPIDLVVTSTPEICVISRTEARAVLGAALFAGGMFVTVIGVVLLVGVSKVGGRLGEAAGAVISVAGAPEVGVPLAAGGSAVASKGARRAATEGANRRGRRQLSERRAAERKATPAKSKPPAKTKASQAPAS